MKKLVYILLAGGLGVRLVHADNLAIESAPAKTSLPVISPSIESQVAVKTVESAPATPAVTNANASYINRMAYLQDPYNSENYPTTGGGTLVVNESQVVHQNIMQKLFTDGTYNIYAGGGFGWNGYSNIGQIPAPNNTAIAPYSYGANLFGQTGQINGFSLGGLVTVLNPIGANRMNGLNTQQGYYNYNIYDPSYAQAGVSEAFLEYQYHNVFQADIGYIGINNSPWLNGNYENNLISVPATYQGMLFNYYPGGGWLLTALAFNAAQYGAAMGFTGNTNYSITDQGISNNNGFASSNGTVAIGANYVSNDNNYNLRLWGYQFDNYGTLLYSDTNLTLPVNDKMSFGVGAQIGTDQQWFQANNAITQYSNQIIQSYMAGLKLNWTYDWFQLNLSANTMWGSNNSFDGGVMVSPYTVGQSVDPTYSNGWMTNMISQRFVGSEYKLGTQFGFLNNNLTIIPQYIYTSSVEAAWNGTQEADLIANYSIPQVRGLFLFGVFGNQWLPSANPQGNNAWTSEFGVFYAY